MSEANLPMSALSWVCSVGINESAKAWLVKELSSVSICGFHISDIRLKCSHTIPMPSSGELSAMSGMISPARSTSFPIETWLAVNRP